MDSIILPLSLPWARILDLNILSLNLQYVLSGMDVNLGKFADVLRKSNASRTSAFSLLFLQLRCYICFHRRGKRFCLKIAQNIKIANKGFGLCQEYAFLQEKVVWLAIEFPMQITKQRLDSKQICSLNVFLFLASKNLSNLD